MLSHCETGAAASIHEDLSRIVDPAVNVAACHREAPTYSLSPQDLDQIDDVAGKFAVATLRAALRDRLLDAGYPDRDAATFSADITHLAASFARIMDTDRVAIRLEVVDTDACRRFHADYVTARLICTYTGPGTQWLDDVDAAALAAGADVATLTIRQIGTGDVAIFKGRSWAPDTPAIHRSPPVAGTGERRLVLVIDPAPAAHH